MSYQDLTPTERGLKSLQLFRTLPLTFKFTPQAKAKFKAAKLAAASAATATATATASTLFVGRFQQQRSNLLISSALQGKLQQVEQILLEGADINVRNGYGQTPLYCACWQGQAAVVRALLAFDANTTIVSNSQSSCQQIATHHNHHQVLALLCNHQQGTPPPPPPPPPPLSTTSPPWHLLHPIAPPPHSGLLLPTILLTTPNPVFFVDFDLQSPVLEYCKTKFEQYTGESVREGASAFNTNHRNKNTKNLEMKTPHGERHTDPARRFFCDEEGTISKHIIDILQQHGIHSLHTIPATGATPTKATPRPPPPPPPTIGQDQIEQISILPYMRFLLYDQPGQQLLPHTDAAKYGIASTAKSTHTWILFLSDSSQGGATQFVDRIHTGTESKQHTDSTIEILASVSPKRGRLLIFPHQTPHAGEKTGTSFKLLLRGEMMSM